MTGLQRLDAGLAAKAAAALDKIQREAGTDALPEVITRLKGLPALLRSSGLPATMAFLYAKAGEDKPLERAYRTVRDALLNEAAVVWGWGEDRPDASEFFTRLGDPSTVDGVAMARATARLEEFANWLRRLAEAVERSGPQPRRRPAAARGEGRTVDG